MIELHRLNNTPIFLNHHMIETVEALPDTVITLTSEKKYIVKESPAQIAELIIAYERLIYLTGQNSLKGDGGDSKNN